MPGTKITSKQRMLKDLRQNGREKGVQNIFQVRIFQGLTIINSLRSQFTTFSYNNKFFEVNMIQQTEKGVKWTQNKWISCDDVLHSQKLTGKKLTEKLEELDTDATASLSETIDQNLSDVEPAESKMVTIDIFGRTFTVDCLDIQDVRSFMQRVNTLSELRQKKNQIKMVILQSLCKQNKLLTPLLDRECKQYSKNKIKELFR